MTSSKPNESTAPDTEALDHRFQEIRDQFPALSMSVNGQPLVYLDNAATSQKPRVVIDRLRRYYEEENSNVHRGVHELSQTATDAYETTREEIASFIGAERSSEVVFTRGTTEAINLVARSFASPLLKPGDEIIVTMMEHHSNIVPWQLVCEQTGAVLKVAPIDQQGCLVVESLVELFTERTRLLALSHISNALGTINPVKQIVDAAHAVNIPVLVDGAQAVPHQKVNVRAIGCDFYTFSAHKMFGPTGIGVLYGREALLETMPPWQGGGDMIDHVSFSGTTYAALPHKFEAGTPNIAGVIGLGASARYMNDVGFDFISAQENRVLNYALKKLSAIDQIRLVGTAPDRAGVISFLLGSSHPYDVGSILDKMGIAVRTGHHCAEPLMDHWGIPGTVRASFAFYNSTEEVDRLCDGVRRASSMLL